MRSGRSPLLFAAVSELFGLRHYSTMCNLSAAASPVGSYALNVLVSGITAGRSLPAARTTRRALSVRRHRRVLLPVDADERFRDLISPIPFPPRRPAFIRISRQRHRRRSLEGEQRPVKRERIKERNETGVHWKSWPHMFHPTPLMHFGVDGISFTVHP